MKHPGSSFVRATPKVAILLVAAVALIVLPSPALSADGGALELQEIPQTGTTLTVNTTADHDDGVCGTADCTLREAIVAANAASGFTIVQFAPGLSDTITLTGGELAITHALAVSGPGARALAVDGNLSGRVFRIDVPGMFVSLSGLTITRGQLVTSVGNSLGGGIYTTATLTLTDCTISNNSAIGGGTDTKTYYAFGGAIYNHGNLTLVRCTVTGNLAQGGSPTARNNAVSGSGGVGGGIDNADTNAVLTLQNCTFTGNTARGGNGGRSLFGGKGGNGGNGEGGGLCALQGSLAMTNCTLTTNKAEGGAGASGSPAGDPGQAFSGGADTLNATGPIGNTIIAGNTATDIGPDVDGSFKSVGTNLVGNRDGSSTDFTQPGDKTGTTAAPLDPKFGAFGNNGGPTDTVALLTGSPAINSGNDSIMPPTDQRGASRAGESDIGAYEFGGALPTPTPTPTPTSTPIPTPTPTTTPGLVGNVSTRLPVGTADNVLIEGFIVQGPPGSAKKIIVRAIGPSLAPFGVKDALANPTLEIHDEGNGNAIVASNDDWRVTQVGGIITADQSAEIAASGVAPSNDLESAIIANLAPGSYTAVVSGAASGVGTGVVDAYDLSAASPAKLANIATRGLIQPGDKLMIAGFIVQNAPVQAVVRAIGPSLNAFGIANALPDTTLQLRDENGAIVVENDDWKVRTNGSSQQAELEATGLQPTNDLEAAFVATLQPGQYTAQVRGKPETTGIGVVQIYFLQ
jgi:CSLREA domain-containing protein